MQHDGDTLRVIFVGSDLVSLAAMRERVRSAPDMDVAAEAWSLDRAGEVIADLHPDVAVVDVSALGQEGICEIQKLRGAFPDVHVVAVSSNSDPLFAEQILRAGALGFVVSPTGLEFLPEAIRTVVHENAYVNRRIAGGILAKMMRRPAADPLQKLTRREREIFDLIASHDAGQIAERLGLSPRTVASYYGRIRTKLNLASLAELSEYARRWVSEQV